MRRLLRFAGVTTSILCGIVVSAHSEDLARVTADRVNLRGGPSLDSEAIIVLQRNEQVTVVAWPPTNAAPAAKAGEWAKVRLPADTPVWVYAPFVDSQRQVVRSEKLNVRAGPGLNFSVLGSLSKGAPISRIRTLDDWMEIEAPTNTFAFVAAQYLERAPVDVASAPTPPAKPAESVAAAPVATTAAAPPPVKTTSMPPAPAESAAAAAPPAPAVAPTVADPAPVAPAPETRKRIVRREGLVRSTVSIQAPTSYELRSIYGAIRLNFLLPASPQINIAKFRGQRVIVAGEEQIEPRWPNLPMLEVQSIRLAP